MSFFELPANGEEAGGIALETLKSTADIDKVRCWRGKGVESFAGRIDDDEIVGGGRDVFGIGAVVSDIGLGALLIGEVGKGVIFNEGELFGFIGEGEADGADAGVEFEDAGVGRCPSLDLEKHLFEERKVGLRKGAGMKGDGSFVECLDEEGLAVDEMPGGAENGVGGGGVDVEPERMPEVVLEKALTEGMEWIMGVDDEGELDAGSGAIDKELGIAEDAGRFVIGGDVVFEEGRAEESGGLVDGWVMDEAVGNGNNVVRVLFEKADVGARTDGELGLEAGLREARGDEGGLKIVGMKEGEGLLPDGRVEGIGKRTARTERKMGASGRIVHKLFTRCSRVVEKIGGC